MYFLLQKNRLDFMDVFFSSVASLMSVLLRRCVVNTLDDLLAQFELKMPCAANPLNESSERMDQSSIGIHIIKIFLVNFFS